MISGFGHVWVRIEPASAPAEVTWQVTSDPALHFDWSAVRQDITHDYFAQGSPRRSVEQRLAEMLADQADEELERWGSQHESGTTVEWRVRRGEQIPEQSVHWSWLHGPRRKGGDGAS